MTPFDSEKLSRDEKANIIWEKGKKFDQRFQYGKHIWQFYLVFDFIAEVQCNIEENKIERIVAFQPFTLGTAVR
jgi:hypothetical protein